MAGQRPEALGLYTKKGVPRVLCTLHDAAFLAPEKQHNNLLCITSGIMMHIMSTKNQRTTITLSPSTHALMKELATLNEESMSATIGGLLEQVSPVLQRVVAVLRAANQAKDAVKGRLADDLEQAQARMEKSIGLVMDDFGSMEQPFLDLFEDVKRRSPKAATATGSDGGERDARQPTNGRGAAAATPPSNRGVRSHTKNTSNQVLARLSARNAKIEFTSANPHPKRGKK